MGSKGIENESEKNTKDKKFIRKNKLIHIFFVVIVIIVSIILASYLIDDFLISEIDLFGDVTGILEVHYLDVAQGDSIYIKSGDCDVLIDAGPKSEINHLLQQLAELNVKDLDIVIATHPHEDHIGGMVGIFDTYKVKKFYMPKVTNTTMVFENMINSIKNEELKIKTIKEGTKIKIDGGGVIKAFSPGEEDYDNLNDYSPIMKLTFGETTFMFTGDAEQLAEEEVLSKYSEEDLKSDVIKIGHHGSTTSSSEDFIKAVLPKYGIISCGEDNPYGHPRKKTLKTLSKYNIEIYRTDKQGQITAISDGETIEFTTEK